MSGGRRRCPGHLLLPLATSCFLLDAPVTPRASPTPPLTYPLPLDRSPSPGSLFPSLPVIPERTAARPQAPPRPPPSPRLSDAPPSSAVTSPSLPRSHKTPGALERRYRRHLLPLHRRPSSLDSPPTERPRPRPRARWTRGEPLNRSPLLPMPLGRSSHCFRRSRDAPPHGLVAGEIPVTIWSRACTVALAVTRRAPPAPQLPRL